MERLLGRLLLLAGAVIVVGSLLPWHTVSGLGTGLNIDGIDTPNNGLVTLVFGVVLAGLAWRMVDTGNRPWRLILGVVAAGTVATVWALLDATNADDDFVGNVRLIRAYGQWVLGAGTALAVVSSLLLARRSASSSAAVDDGGLVG